jgi:hypothetical protein
MGGTVTAFRIDVDSDYSEAVNRADDVAVTRPGQAASLFPESRSR